MPKTEKEGSAPQTMEAALAGRKTEPLATVFPPVWSPENPGEYLIGEYIGMNSEPKGKFKFNSFEFALETTNGNYIRAKNPYIPVKGEIVSVSGEVLDRAFAKVKAGKIAIKYLGLGEKKGKNNPAKLFEVLVIE